MHRIRSLARNTHSTTWRWKPSRPASTPLLGGACPFSVPLRKRRKRCSERTRRVFHCHDQSGRSCTDCLGDTSARARRRRMAGKRPSHGSLSRGTSQRQPWLRCRCLVCVRLAFRLQLLRPERTLAAYSVWQWRRPWLAPAFHERKHPPPSPRDGRVAAAVVGRPTSGGKRTERHSTGRKKIFPPTPPKPKPSEKAK